MEAPTEIEKLIAQGDLDSDRSYANMIYILMAEFHQPYSEIKKMPIPLILNLIDIYNKVNKDNIKKWKQNQL